MRDFKQPRPSLSYVQFLAKLEELKQTRPLTPEDVAPLDNLKRRTPMGIFTIQTSRVDGSRMDQAFISFDDSRAVNRRSPKRAHQQWKDWLRENPL